jgi:hypothetical protein
MRRESCLQCRRLLGHSLACLRLVLESDQRTDVCRGQDSRVRLQRCRMCIDTHLHVCVRAGRWKVAAGRRCAAALLPLGSCPASLPLSIPSPTQPAGINYEHLTSQFQQLPAGWQQQAQGLAAQLCLVLDLAL